MLSFSEIAVGNQAPRRFKSSAAAFAIAALTALSSACAAASPSEQRGEPTADDLRAAENLVANWDALLREHVSEGELNGVRLTLLDYAAVAADPRWEQVVRGLAASSEPEERDARMAYWINAYNILCVKVVLSAYPVESVKDVGSLLQSVWKKEAGFAAGAARSLDEVEHQILRPMGDARVHAAIVCASVSCPDLRPEAYAAERLGEQLDEQMREFLRNPTKGARFDTASGRLHLSSIFSWFSEDFEQEKGTVLAYVRDFMPSPVVRRLTDDTRVVSMDYDWSLNDAARLR